MQPILRKVISFQIFIFIAVGSVIGYSMIFMVNLPQEFLFMLVLTIAFPFIAFVFRDIRRLLMVCIIITIPLTIDINFMHRYENQAGAVSLGIALIDVFVLLLVIWWAVESHSTQKKSVRLFGYITFPAILHFEAALLTIIWSPKMDLAIFELALMFKVLVTYFVLANQIYTKKDMRIVIWSIIAIIFMQSIIATFQMVLGQTLSLSFLGEMQIETIEGAGLQRVGGTLGHPNRLAMFLELLLPVCLAASLMEKDKKLKTIALAVFALGFAALIMTGSRGGWIASFLSFIVFFYFGIRNHRVSTKSVVKLNFVAFLVITLAATIFSEKIINRFTGDDHGSAMSRIPMFQIAFSIIEEHPIGGVGINNYAEIMREHNNTILGRRFTTIPRPVHNMYLLVAGETGLIGLGTFLILLFIVFKTLLKLIRSKDAFISLLAIGLLCGILSLAIHGMVDKHPLGNYHLFYVFLALTVAANDFNKQQIEKNNSPI